MKVGRREEEKEMFLSFDLLRFDFVNFFIDLRNSLEKIGNQAKIGNLEDRCIRIFVDCDDCFRVFHTGKMLDCARNADGNIEFLEN